MKLARGLCILHNRYPLSVLLMKNSCYVLPVLLLFLSVGCKKPNEPKPADSVVVNSPVSTGPLGITFSNKPFVGESMAFNSNQPAGTKLLWKFGDGGTSEEVNPVHIYTKPGYYNIIVTDNITTVTKQVTISAGCSRMTNTREWDQQINYSDISGTTLINSSVSIYALSSTGENYINLPGDSSSGYFLQKPSLYFESYDNGVLTMSNKGENSSPVLKYYVARDSVAYSRSFSMISPTKCSYILTCHTN